MYSDVASVEKRLSVSGRKALQEVDEQMLSSIQVLAEARSLSFDEGVRLALSIETIMSRHTASMRRATKRISALMRGEANDEYEESESDTGKL